MPLNIPQTMQSLLTGDSAASRAFQLTKNAVDPLLGFVNGAFNVMADGSLRVVRSLVTSAFKADTTDAGTLTASSVTVNGPANVTGPLNVAGPSTLNGVASVGANTFKGTVVVQKKDDGTLGSLLVQNNCTVTGALSAATGIKTIGPIFAYNGSLTAGSYINLGNSGLQWNMYHKYPFAGSVVGVLVSFYCSATTSTLQFIVTGSSGDIVSTYGPNNFTNNVWFANTYAKGTYPFVANGDLICKVYCPTAISSIQVVMYPVLEFVS